MITTALATLSISSYLASTVLIIRHINQSQMPRLPFYLAWAAVISHLFYTGIIFFQNNGFSFSFFSTSSLIAMIVALLLLIAAINKPIEKLGVALFPIAALMLGLAVNFADKTPTLAQHNWAMSTHILTSIIAFSLLNIAALQAILLCASFMRFIFVVVKSSATIILSDISFVISLKPSQSSSANGSSKEIIGNSLAKFL